VVFLRASSCSSCVARVVRAAPRGGMRGTIVTLAGFNRFFCFHWWCIYERFSSDCDRIDAASALERPAGFFDEGDASIDEVRLDVGAERGGVGVSRGAPTHVPSDVWIPRKGNVAKELRNV